MGRGRYGVRGGYGGRGKQGKESTRGGVLLWSRDARHLSVLDVGYKHSEPTPVSEP